MGPLWEGYGAQPAFVFSWLDSSGSPHYTVGTVLDVVVTPTGEASFSLASPTTEDGAVLIPHRVPHAASQIGSEHYHTFPAPGTSYICAPPATLHCGGREGAVSRSHSAEPTSPLRELPAILSCRVLSV